MFDVDPSKSSDVVSSVGISALVRGSVQPGDGGVQASSSTLTTNNFYICHHRTLARDTAAMLKADFAQLGFAASWALEQAAENRVTKEITCSEKVILLVTSGLAEQPVRSVKMLLPLRMIIFLDVSLTLFVMHSFSQLVVLELRETN